MIKNLFKKSIALADDEKAESDLALRLMFEIAISDGTLDSAELDIIKKRAQGSSNAELSVSSIVKKIIDENTKWLEISFDEKIGWIEKKDVKRI